MSDVIEKSPQPRSQSRQRQAFIGVRCTLEEHLKITADAQSLGLAAGGYLRMLGMGQETPRTSRQPLPNAEELAKLLGQVGKIGGNLNQLTKLANQGQLVPPSALNACLSDVRVVLSQLNEALNRDC